MTRKTDAHDDRQERLGKQLRANMARRKAQSRASRSGKGDQRKDGLPAINDARAPQTDPSDNG